MENLKKFKIANPKQILGGRNSVVVQDEVIFLQSIVITDEVLF